MKTRILVIAGITACCPTLWIQMVKTAPAPWPDLADPVGSPPPVPVNMQNRFDVLEDGELVRRAPGYTDDPAQESGAVSELDGIIRIYGDHWLAPCARTVTGHVVCTHPNASGLSANCNALKFDAPLASAAKLVFVAGQARLAEPVDQNMVALSERIDAADGAKVDVCVAERAELSKPLLSFVHMSDIQLRDPTLILTDRRLSKRLDWFQALSSFEYDEDMAFYNQYVLQSVVATINAAAQTTPAELAPSFVIHTGDSIDAGMVSELARFHTMIDRLHIPFFEAFGNHDVLVFGNLTPTDQFASLDDSKCAQVASLIGSQTAWAPNKICVDTHVKPCQNCTTRDTQLVASTNSQADTRRTFIQQLMHTPEQAVAEPKNDPLGDYCEATHPRIRNAAYSRTHGYDLGTADDTLTGDPLGYYAFTYTLGPDRNAVFVVLDSEELDDHVGGIAGHIKHEQLSWLQRVLACVHDKHSSDLVFVFAHQPLSMLQVDAQDTTMDVEATLRSSRNVIAYLFGHNHTNSICNDNRVDANGRRTTCTRFWEIETSSLIEFPQEARMVRIKQAAQNLGFLEVSTFQENLSSATAQMRQFLELAHRGAERDFCVTHNARCSADQRVYREDGDSTTARLFFRMP